MLEKDGKNAPLYCPDDLKIVWKGMQFYPVSLTIGFDQEGNVVNWCRFHDLKADSLAGAEIREVKPLIEKDTAEKGD